MTFDLDFKKEFLSAEDYVFDYVILTDMRWDEQYKEWYKFCPDKTIWLSHRNDLPKDLSDLVNTTIDMRDWEFTQGKWKKYNLEFVFEDRFKSLLLYLNKQSYKK